MKRSERYEQALRSEQPRECLTAVVRDLVTKGGHREAILIELEDLRRILQVEGRDGDEDVVLEVMDFLVGFCSPQMRI
ncbi:MAG: hypothetical protein H0V51_05580 [Chloroflexi bacterium]|nr:hypothetical protein [Chloroflexota bacterium]